MAVMSLVKLSGSTDVSWIASTRGTGNSDDFKLDVFAS